MALKITSDNIASATLSTLGGVKITTVAYPGSVTAANPAGGETITVTGSGFNSGIIVYINNTIPCATTYINSTSLTFVAPATGVGTYNIVLYNTDGSSGVKPIGIIFSSLPTWVTSSGALLAVSINTSYSTSVTATGDGTITYSLTSGSLPTGLSLNSSTGAITGTPTVEETSNFSITATDSQNQTTSRSFSIAVVTTVSAVEYLVVAGGGGGGGGLGGGGGAGGLLTASGFAISAGTPYTVTVGAGGAGATAGVNATGTNGSPSYIADSSSSTYSGSFNGTSQYLATASSSQLDFGTGDFTIECWVNSTSVGNNYPTFLASVTGWSAGASGHRFNNTGYANKFWFGLNGSAGVSSGDPFMVSSSTFSFNTWYHYALTRSGNTWKMYINGSLEATGTYSGSYNLGLGGTRVGNSAWDGAGGYYTGNVSNLRVVKGVAVYTGNFTVPAGPLTATQSAGTNITAITGTQTSLLTLQDATIVDNSTFAATITNTGSITTSTTTDPLNTGSKGGGGGGTCLSGGGAANNGLAGGSGGGGSGVVSGPAATGGTATSGQGFAGGTGATGTGAYGGAGGGGASAVGATGKNTGTGAGGNGLASSLSGSSVTYGGGGGGGSDTTPGLGGTGGGGNSGTPSAGNGVAGTANRGGGGGGGSGGGSNGGSGGTGGSGIVIIRYADTFPLATSTTGSPTITTAGGYRVYTFTASGSITF